MCRVPVETRYAPNYTAGETRPYQPAANQIEARQLPQLGVHLTFAFRFRRVCP